MATGLYSRVQPQNEEDYGPAILGVCISTISVAVVCVLTRIYIRIRLTHSFWFDDYFIVAAAVRPRILR